MSEVLKHIQQYYVYHCHVDGVLKYIGMGKGTRYKHCYSGTSSCSELNKDFHEGKEITVTKIKEKMTKNDAQLLEMSHILSHEGLYNKRKEIDYTQIPDVKRSSKYKILGSLQQNENRSKVLQTIGKKGVDITEEVLKKLRELLSEASMDILLVQYENSTPILILDKVEINDYEIKHLGCRNWPNCSMVGCGEW